MGPAIGFGAPFTVETGGRPYAAVKHHGVHCPPVVRCFRQRKLFSVIHVQMTLFLFLLEILYGPSLMYRRKYNCVYFLLSPHFPIFILYLFTFLPLSLSSGRCVCVILTYVYKTGFYCCLNTSGPTHSSQPAEQALGTVSCSPSEIGRNRGRAAWVNGGSSSLLTPEVTLNQIFPAQDTGPGVWLFCLELFPVHSTILLFSLILGADRAGENISIQKKAIWSRKMRAVLKLVVCRVPPLL